MILSSELDTTDLDTADSALVYTVTFFPLNGTLLRNGAFATTFTQADINASRVTYVHNGSETTGDSFEFSVSDGTTTLANNIFEITVTPAADGPTVRVENGRLIIDGTGSGDIVTVTGVGVGAGVYDVITQQRTVRVSGVISDILINLHGGDDRLTMNLVYVNGAIDITTEGGQDTVILGNNDVVSSSGELRVNLGADSDTLDGKRLYIGTNQIIGGGDGDDTMSFEGFLLPEFTLGTSAAGSATWIGGAGNDTVQVVYGFIVGAWGIDLGEGTDAFLMRYSATHLANHVEVSGGAGADTLEVDANFIFASLLMDGMGEADSLKLANNLFTQVAMLIGGDGDDTVTVQNQTNRELRIDTGSGRDNVTVAASLFDELFASLGDDDDELTTSSNARFTESNSSLTEIFDGGLGFDRLLTDSIFASIQGFEE